MQVTAELYCVSLGGAWAIGLIQGDGEEYWSPVLRADIQVSDETWDNLYGIMCAGKHNCNAVHGGLVFTAEIMDGMNARKFVMCLRLATKEEKLLLNCVRSLTYKA